MERLRTLFLILASILIVGIAQAQELNCKVTINSDQIQGTNKSVFEALQKAVTEFMNERQWTDYEYQVSERIECSLYIVVKTYSSNTFSAELQIQANRPIYNSSYKSPIFSFTDKNFNFNYTEGDPLNFDATSFGKNLTEVLAYYAYIIIGTDCDSFSKLGGTPFYRKAEQIVNQAQSTNESGWKAFEDNKNRYALINNILDEVVTPYREYFYTYHRLGLDEMSLSADKSRTRIVEGLPILKTVYKSRPSVIIINEFVETKMDEIINIYSKASSQERKDAYEILSYIVPTMQNSLSALK